MMTEAAKHKLDDNYGFISEYLKFLMWSTVIVILVGWANLLGESMPIITVLIVIYICMSVVLFGMERKFKCPDILKITICIVFWLISCIVAALIYTHSWNSPGDMIAFVSALGVFYLMMQHKWEG